MKASIGFTLVELLMGLAILSIVTTTVVPSFSQLIAEQRLRQVSNELRLSLALARSEAIKRNESVNVLPVANTWSEGWCVEPNAAGGCTSAPIGAYVVPKNIRVSGASGATGIAFNSWGRTASCPRFEIATSVANSTCSLCLYIEIDGRAVAAPGTCANRCPGVDSDFSWSGACSL
ncbi:MAG: GspH/FimT family pseudopilin [Luminiphilus sp.]|nr:GspH/FimT family pseudopilin [Luminiphilus sp.]